MSAEESTKKKPCYGVLVIVGAPGEIDSKQPKCCFDLRASRLRRSVQNANAFCRTGVLI